MPLNRDATIASIHLALNYNSVLASSTASSTSVSIKDRGLSISQHALLHLNDSG